MDNSTNSQIRAACLLAAALAENPAGLTREDADNIVAAMQSLLIEIHRNDPNPDPDSDWYDLYQEWESGGDDLHEMFGLSLTLDREV